MLLCQVLGHGFFQLVKRNKVRVAHIYTVNNQKGLIHVADLINGKWSKIHQFIKLIEYILFLIRNHQN